MIYQILIDRFNGGWTTPPANTNDFLGGTINGITDKLDYIQSIGATQIWLSPFFHNAEKSYHGYHTIDFESIDPHFGTWSDLENLIRKAHDRKMKVIADFVPNHCHVNHPFFQDALKNRKNSKYRKWFYFKNDNSDEYLSFLQYKELAKLNLENEPTAQYLVGVGERLAKIGIDGFRIDHAMGVPFSFLRRFRERMHALNPQTIVFGEVWAMNVSRRYFSTLRFKSYGRKLYYWLFGLKQEQLQLDYKDVLDGVLDFQFRNVLLDEIKKNKRLLNNPDLEEKLKRHISLYSSNNMKIFPFVDNHDTNRFLYYCNNDSSLLKEALQIIKETGLEYVYYYGTEYGMCNTVTIENGDDFADLRVREPLPWDTSMEFAADCLP